MKVASSKWFIALTTSAIITVTFSPSLLAQTSAGLPVTPEIIRYEARNPRSPDGDKLAEPRRLAAVIVGQARAAPARIVDVGSFTGEYLEAMLDRFPSAKGQWTEPVENNHETALRRLGRFGDRVSYVIGCPARDISLGCIPTDMDVLVSSWLTIHRDAAGIASFFRTAFSQLPAGGMVAIIDHMGGEPDWQARMDAARKVAAAGGLAALSEGPPVHHPEYRTPQQEAQIKAMRDAGFVDVTVQWTRFDTFLYTGRKP